MLSNTFPMPQLSPQAHKERTFAALLQLCLSLSQQGPLVLEIENLHWIDATSEEWLAALVEHIVSRPILVLGSFRPGYRSACLEASYVTQLSLARLTARESLQVIQAVSQRAQLPASLVHELLAKADGNPFFLEELTYAVVERGRNQMPDIPDTVQAVLAARIDRLPAPKKRLLQMAAVIGKDVSLPLLEDVADRPTTELHQGLQHLQTAEFLYKTSLFPAATYTFKHALTREVAYQSLLLNTRQRYHHQIAQHLSAHFAEATAMHPELLAHHYTEAGLFEQALPYWQHAGEQAVARSANVEAISHFTRGLEVLKSLPETAERNQRELKLQLALSVPLFMIKKASAVGSIAQRVLELCHDLEDHVQYFPGFAVLWRFFFNTGQFHKAQELGQQCFALAHQAQDLALLQETHMMLGSNYLYLGEPTTAHTHFQHSMRFYEAQQVSRVAHQVTDPSIACLCRQSQTLWLLGYADQALATINRALTLAQATAHTFSLVMTRYCAATIHQCRREISALHEDAEAITALARKHEFAYYIAIGQFLQGVVLAEQGAPEVGLTQLYEALTVWKLKGMGLSSLYIALAAVHHKCGQIEAALQVLDDVLTVVHTYAERLYEAEVYRLRGEFLLHPSILDSKQAETCLQRACAIAERQHAKAWELRAIMSLSRLWHQQGKHLAARQKLEPIYSWFTEGFATPDLLEARAFLDGA